MRDSAPRVRLTTTLPIAIEKADGRAIVTTTPNSFFGRFHDRQVCSVTPQEADQWMTATRKEDAVALLHPAAEDEWEAVPVDDRIFKPGRREMEDLVPIGKPIRG